VECHGDCSIRAETKNGLAEDHVLDDDVCDPFQLVGFKALLELVIMHQVLLLADGLLLNPVDQQLLHVSVWLGRAPNGANKFFRDNIWGNSRRCRHTR